MTAPVPEDQDQPLVGTATPPGEHETELPTATDGDDDGRQEENAATSLDEPSDDAGGGE